jgi:hypothetical protein
MIAAISVSAPVFAGDWCVFDDGTHVHVGCSDYTNDQYNNRHRHEEETSHEHPGHEFSEADCIVHHAATPAQLCPSGDGLQYYFIGADGTAETGPFVVIPSAGSPAVQLYSGSNPMTGKSVVIDFLTDGSNRLKVSTYYPDNEYDTNKAYVFSVNDNNTVTHISW